MTPVLIVEGDKYYPGELEWYQHFLLSYRRYALRQLILLSEMDAVWPSPTKELVTEAPDKALEMQVIWWVHLAVSRFFLRAKEGAS